jgi:hypothetical protein
MNDISLQDTRVWGFGRPWGWGFGFGRPWGWGFGFGSPFFGGLLGGLLGGALTAPFYGGFGYPSYGYGFPYGGIWW